MPSEKKQIRVTEEQRDRLHDMTGPGETYADAVAELFETYDDDTQES